MYGKGSIRSFFDYSSFSRSIEKAKVGSGGAAAARATYGQMSIFGGGPPLHSTPLRSHIILAHSFTPLRPSWLLRLLLRRMYTRERLVINGVTAAGQIISRFGLGIYVGASYFPSYRMYATCEVIVVSYIRLPG